jgi:hypothetical protein
VEDLFESVQRELCVLLMAVSDVRDYLLCVENDKAEALRIAERASKSMLENSVTGRHHLLTRTQNCSRARLVSWIPFSLSENT